MVKIAFTLRLKQYHQLIKSVKSKPYFVRISYQNNLTFAWEYLTDNSFGTHSKFAFIYLRDWLGSKWWQIIWLGTDKHSSNYLTFEFQIRPFIQFLTNPMYQSSGSDFCKTSSIILSRSVDFKATFNRILFMLTLTNNLRSSVNSFVLRFYYTFIGQLNPINRNRSAAGEQ